jgi:2-polyprenyl-3-methyl-5-hydroxy-6-metoxy-1,4-benzoquinol methylase
MEMKSKQQEEALDYFKTHAAEWAKKAISSERDSVNVIQQRNQFVLKVLDTRTETKKALDVGSGTGDLVCDMAKRGVSALGIDYAQEMVDIAQERKSQLQLEMAQFECCSIFDGTLSGASFDLIAANGFIEYLSRDEMQDFFDLVKDLLAPNASFVVSVRNRLFNLVSMSSFTSNEFSGTDVDALMNEALALSSNTVLTDLLEIEPAALQETDIKLVEPGVAVESRYQYTPIQIMRMLATRGLEAVELYPVHIHGVPPAFKKQHPEIHTSISNLLQSQAENSPELIPFASTFMLHLMKGE